MALAGGIDVSIRAHAGSFVLDAAFQTGPGATAILGESGAGKSLTLRAIAGLLRPDSGRISVRGTTVFDSDSRVDVPIRRRRLGYVFQDYALFPHLTVRRNLAFGLRGVPRDEAQRTVARVAELLEIGELLDRMPGQLSGGQRQRAAVGRALATEPNALLLDEPFSALDAPTRASLTEQFFSLQRTLGVPSVLVTHDVDEAYALADRMVVLSRGRVLQAGPREEVFWSPSSPEVARLVGVQNLLPAVVTNADRNRLRVDAQGLTLDASANGLRVGERVVAGVRAADLSARPVQPGEEANATLIRVIDRGATLTGLLALRDGSEVRVVLDRSSAPGPAAWTAWRVEQTGAAWAWDDADAGVSPAGQTQDKC